MPGERSVLGHVQITDPDAFSADRPMSALETLLMRNNVQHLVDVGVQYRVNWVASTSEAGYGTLEGNAARSQFATVFPLTITDPDRMPSLDIRVATRGIGSFTSGTFSMTVREIYNNDPIYFDGAVAVSSAAAQWHERIAEVDRPWKGRNTIVPFNTVASSGLLGVTYTPGSFVQVMLMLNGPAEMTFIGVQVREYLLP